MEAKGKLQMIDQFGFGKRDGNEQSATMTGFKIDRRQEIGNLKNRFT
jgi:hypothetical protein